MFSQTVMVLSLTMWQMHVSYVKQHRPKMMIVINDIAERLVEVVIGGSPNRFEAFWKHPQFGLNQVTS